MTEESLFHEALAKPPAERAAFLEAACADEPQLRAAVEALLAAHAASGHPLDRPVIAKPDATGEFERAQPAPTRATTDHVPIADEGEVIAGRYKLEQRIGEGGMGEVWVAKQTEPIKRRVALKLIKAGMDSRSLLIRFEQERQALAMMDHPNIAKVLDGGLTADRRPFFVMELVNGLPLMRYCDEIKLGIRERLELFVPICQAVQHAHQKGIVHRDLKPSNILITVVDGRPVPKVIDFGVAKAISGNRLADESMSTQFGAVVGTLEYMSPEQAGFSGADVDTRADIYSLGVILYELLTGLRPFDARSLKKAAFDEMIRMIREQEPSKPSTRLSTDASLPSLAATRQTEPKRLTKLLRGELDWVVMKCLEKQRDRRYETANGLARDVQHYLADEPVEARPPSARYRLRKFVKRNKGRVVAAVLVVLALIGGIVGTTFGLLEARASERQAKAEQQRADTEARNARTQEGIAIEQREAAEAATKLADEAARNAKTQEGIAKTQEAIALEQKRKAEKALVTVAEQRLLALETVRSVLLRVDDRMKNDIHLAGLRVDIIQRMLDDIDRIRDHALKNPLVDRTEAVAYSRIGEIYYTTNRIQDAVDWLKKAYAVLKAVAAEDPQNPVAMRNLAAISHQLADAEWRLGNGTRARALHAEGLKLRLERLKMAEKADDLQNRADALFDVAEGYGYVAFADLRLGDPEKAVENYRASDAHFLKLPEYMVNFLKVRRIRSEIQVRLGDAQSKLHKNDEANAHYQTALRQREAVLKATELRGTTRQRDIVTLLKTDIGQSRMYLGDFYLMARKDAQAADAQYRIAHKIFLEVLDAKPESLDLRQRVGASHYRLGITAGQRPAAALAAGNVATLGMREAHYAECLKLRQELAEIDARDTQGQVELLLAQARLGQAASVERVVDRLLHQAGDDRQVLFQIACGLAILSDDTGERAVQFRIRCFQILDKLIDRGWRDRGAFDQDPDLDPIRADRRYNELLGRIKP